MPFVHAAVDDVNLVLVRLDNLLLIGGLSTFCDDSNALQDILRSISELCRTSTRSFDRVRSFMLPPPKNQAPRSPSTRSPAKTKQNRDTPRYQYTTITANEKVSDIAAWAQCDKHALARENNRAMLQGIRAHSLLVINSCLRMPAGTPYNTRFVECHDEVE